MDVDHDHPEDRGRTPPVCTLLVASCDSYADLWKPYFALLRRHWPDCPFPVALITEERDPALDGVRALCLGTGRDWSSLLLGALDAIGTPYVLLTLEDFFLRSGVDTSRVTRLFDQVQQLNLKMLRLVPRPGPTDPFIQGREYGAIGPDASYRVSTQAAFWQVATLRRLIVEGETAWEFEVNASRRSVDERDFVAVWRPALTYRHHVIERGKWFPWAAWRFKRLGIGVDLTARSVMTSGEALRWILGKSAHPVVQRLPRTLRLALKPMARWLGFVS